MKSEIPMREYVIRSILQDAMNCVSTEKLCLLGIVLASACVETQFIASYKGSHP